MRTVSYRAGVGVLQRLSWQQWNVIIFGRQMQQNRKYNNDIIGQRIEKNSQFTLRQMASVLIENPLASCRWARKRYLMKLSGRTASSQLVLYHLITSLLQLWTRCLKFTTCFHCDWGLAVEWPQWKLSSLGILLVLRFMLTIKMVFHTSSCLCNGQWLPWAGVCTKIQNMGSEKAFMVGPKLFECSKKN